MVSATTTAAATGRCQPVGTAYAATVNAMAAHEAVLPMQNDHPAAKPHHGPRRSRP